MQKKNIALLVTAISAIDDVKDMYDISSATLDLAQEIIKKVIESEGISSNVTMHNVWFQIGH